MPHLNLNYGLVIYEDQSDRNPQVKTPDISKSIMAVGVNFDKSDRVTLYPNETKDIVTTQRSLGWTSLTQLHFERYLSGSDNMRLSWTGTGPAPAFRTDRAIGGAADTVVSITRVTPYVARITNTSGTAWDLSNVQPNDYIKFEKNTDAFTSPFSSANLGVTLLVQAKGSNYVDFVDNGNISLDPNVTLGADYATAVLVMSQGPVKIGDTLQIDGAGINPSNRGKFEVVDASPEYVEVVNALGVDETVTYGSNSLVVYEYLIGFVHLRSSCPVKVKFGDQTEWATIGRLGPEGLFLGSVSTHRVQAFNDGPEPVTISVQHAMVL